MPKRSSSVLHDRVSKRVRHERELDSEDELDGSIDQEEDEITPASNAVSSRRARVSGIGSQTNAVGRPISQRTTQPNDMNDDNEDEDEAEEQEIADRVANRIRYNERHGFSNCGILESIRLDRFMSHECFECPLGPNVNIINGANGSGKSAIVAALQIGLAARPSATERGSKLEDHIKHGRDSAIISIRILNHAIYKENGEKDKADMSFKHEVYGDVITIERRLMRGTKSSASKWNVKGYRNRRINLPDGQTARKEVLDIVDHFGFMVENPVSILTQTKSKAFLAAGKPVEHYKLYREATLLGPLEDELEMTVRVTAEVKDILKARVENLPKAEKELRKLEIAHEQAQQMKNIDRMINEAQILYAWTIVQEEEIKLEDFQKRTEEEFEPAAERADAAFKTAEEHLEELKQVQRECTDDTTKKTEELQVMDNNMRSAQKKDMKTDMEISRQKRSLEEYRAEINSLEQRLGEAKDRKERAREQHFAGQEQKSNLIRQIREIDDAESKRKDEIKSYDTLESQLQEENMSVRDDLTRAKSERDRLQSEFENKRREQMRISQAMRNKDNLYRFGNTIPELCQRIRQNERRFSHLPIGPLGQYVKLQDESWAAAIELAIGRNTLQSFLVNNSRDASLLQDLIPRGGPRPIIVIANLNRSRYDIRPEDMPKVQHLGHKTILESVDIQHNAVFNTLVDQSQIERNVLDGSNREISDLGWSRIPNLHIAWNKQGERAYIRGGSSTYRRAPRNCTAQYLTTDLRPYLQSIEREISNIRGELEEANRRVRSIENRQQEISSESNAFRRQLQQLKNEGQRALQKRTSLEDALNRAENAFDPEPYDREIRELEDSRIAQQAIAENCQHEIETLEQKRADFASELARAKQEYRNARSEVAALSKRLDDVQTKVAKVKSRMRNIERDKIQHGSRLDRARREIEEQKMKVAEGMESARSFAPCPDNVNSKEISSERARLRITSLEKRRDTERERRGGKSAQEIEAEYLRSKKKHQENMQHLKRVQFYAKALSSGIVHRRDLLTALNKSLKKSVRANFRQFLQTKGHYGNIFFSTENNQRELHITTQMASHKMADGERHVTTDLRSLSGGERSYTTLCFMLALAEICQNPVRVMDEIDVFQDESNRRASFKTMIDYFNQYLPNIQIIIITPLSLPNVQPSRAVNIQRLRAPRDRDPSRRQTLMDQYAQG